MNRMGPLTGDEREVSAAEIVRNASAYGKYRPIVAARLAVARLKRPEVPKLEIDQRLHCVVNDCLAQECSPEQIGATLVELYLDDPEMRVSHKMIYQSLFLRARG